jgi:NTE family protein
VIAMVKSQDKEAENLQLETVLVLQGGGSLGAYECGVYKALYNHGIQFDILAGSSIGAINAAIICSAQNKNQDATQVLEAFWLDLSENIQPPVGLIPLSIPESRTLALLSSIYSVTCGNSRAFVPRWLIPDIANYFPQNWNYIYDISPLKNTLKRYIDLEGLKKILPDDKVSCRLIISATDIQKGEPVIFDNRKMDVDLDKIVACAGYPFYGIKWTENDGRFLWDGSLLSNTPMLDVIHASPMYDKKYYIVDVFPREQKELPSNMMEVWHRARDIMFMDKTDKSVQMLKEIEKYLSLLKRINNIINASDVQIDKKTKAKLDEITPEYHDLAQRRGAVIKEVIRIGRREKMHFLFEDADFSEYRIKKLIAEGEQDSETLIKEFEHKSTL